MVTLDHGVTSGMTWELAMELSQILKTSPIVYHEVIGCILGTSGQTSIHFTQENAIYCIKNIYAPAFVNQFCENERREDVLRAQTEQIKWIERELARTRQAA
jgi:hypothetical protein